MKYQSVEQSTARTCKEMLWNGETQERIAAILGISQATVSRIRSGTAHADIPWPNGASGAMNKSNETRKELAPDASRFQAFSEEIQRRVLAAVNGRRVEMDLPSIPDMAPELEQYMDAAQGDAEFESTTLEKARAAESLRMAQIMLEFDALCYEGANVRRQEELGAILKGTRRSAKEPTPEVSSSPASLVYEKMDWQLIVDADPKNKLVAKALAAEDPYLIEAICIVFYALRGAKRNWREEYAANQVYVLAERLRESGLELELDRD